MAPAGIVRSRGCCAMPMVKPSFHVVAPSSKARNSVTGEGVACGRGFVDVTAASVAVIAMFLLVGVNSWKEFNYSGPRWLPFAPLT